MVSCFSSSQVTEQGLAMKCVTMRTVTLLILSAVSSGLMKPSPPGQFRECQTGCKSLSTNVCEGS